MGYGLVEFGSVLLIIFPGLKETELKPLIRPVPLSALLFEDAKRKKKWPLLAFGPPRIVDKGHYSQNRQLIPLATIG